MQGEISRSEILLYTVDAFAEEPFQGNPAAVCLLQEKLEDPILQAIASEMNLSETAFVYPLEGSLYGQAEHFSLRWFTPKVEVPLCGHATLATASILFFEIGSKSNQIVFETLSGALTARREGTKIALDFPSDDPVALDRPVELLKAAGIEEYRSIAYGRRTKMILVHVPNEASVKDLHPNFELMLRARTREEIIGVIVTSASSEPYDFISRFFAPWVGINEDPVTGSAHTVLTPYWSKITGKTEMTAYQASSRGGTLTVRMNKNGRVHIVGKAVVIIKGHLTL